MEKFTKINEKTGEIYETKRARFLNWNEINEKTPLNEKTTMIPCGKCEGCRIDKANEWATRAYLEAQNWPKNCFLTLTYSNECLPKKRTLIKADLQKFWKRLRKNEKAENLRYLACGEYGTKTRRPHYHAAVFNYEPTDLKPYKKNIVEDMLYTSETLNKIWGKGYVIVGKLTYESAAYVARYVIKKAYGIDNEYYQKNGKAPEFTVSSRKGGIGINAFKNPKNWEKVKRNLGVLVKTKNGVILKKIPNYLKQKWKELENREQYYKEFDKRAHVFKAITRARLEKTSNNWYQDNKQAIESLKEKLKRLDKRTSN